jgi:hypothetical protein
MYLTNVHWYRSTCAGVLVSNTTDAVGVRFDNAAGVAELVSISIFCCMVDILDKCTIIKVGTGVIISKTTDSVGVRIDTAAGTSQLESGLIPLQGQQS